MADLLLGLDIGGTKCGCVVGTPQGEILETAHWPSQAERGPDPMLEDIAQRARAMCEKHDISAVGVAIGGPLDTNRGLVLAPPHLPGWAEVAFADILRERLQQPVHVEHDAAACALAEALWGARSNSTRLLYLTCGTGFGVGFVIDGVPYYGAHGRSMEIGHNRYADHGPVAFGKRGSVEAFCAGGELGKLAAWLYPERWSKQMPAAPALAELAAQGDREAQTVLHRNAQAVGHVAANLTDLLFPDALLLGSLARYLGDMWLDQVRTAFEDSALPEAREQCFFGPASLAGDLQDLSALAAATRAKVRGPG